MVMRSYSAVHHRASLCKPLVADLPPCSASDIRQFVSLDVLITVYRIIMPRA